MAKHGSKNCFPMTFVNGTSNDGKVRLETGVCNLLRRK